MNRTRFAVPKMDCAAEERLVRMAIQGQPAGHRLDVDLSTRTVDVYHDGPAQAVLHLFDRLNFGAELIETSRSTTNSQNASAGQ